MAFLGKLARFVLNINTIWGLMILCAFVLCAAQHYLPTTSVIPATAFHDGDNAVSIVITDAMGQAQTYDYTLASANGKLAIAANDLKHHADRPWLKSLANVNDSVLLKWDSEAHGGYRLAVNGKDVAAGKLIRLESLTDAAFDYATSAFNLALGFVASMVLLLGLMRVGQDAGIVQIVARVFYPVIRFLFPGVPKDHPANGAILMNWTTTLLGLGNAATPFGLKAMKDLQDLNPHPGVATDSQVMLLGYNTAGLALIPTTLIAMRKAAGCSDPFEIIGTCMVAGAVATVTAIVMVKLLGRLPMFSVKAALVDEAHDAAAAAAHEAPAKRGEDDD